MLAAFFPGVPDQLAAWHGRRGGRTAPCTGAAAAAAPGSRFASWQAVMASGKARGGPAPRVQARTRGRWRAGVMAGGSRRVYEKTRRRRPEADPGATAALVGEGEGFGALGHTPTRLDPARRGCPPWACEAGGTGKGEAAGARSPGRGGQLASWRERMGGPGEGGPGAGQNWALGPCRRPGAIRQLVDGHGAATGQSAPGIPGTSWGARGLRVEPG